MLNSVFARRLYLCWLIQDNERPNVPKLMTLTGWPRRTLQDVLKALPGMGVELRFVQEGVRNNDGYYQLVHWGPLDVKWVAEHRAELITAIEQS